MKRMPMWFMVMLISVAWLTSCQNVAKEARAVKAGDRVKVGYTCRLESGELAATTSEKQAAEPAQAKSVLFMGEKTYADAEVLAGASRDHSGTWDKVDFNSTLALQLGKAVLGMTIGETRSVQLRSQVPEDLPSQERYIKAARFLKRAKEVHMKKETFRQLTGQDPQAGMLTRMEFGLKGEVIGFDADNVAIRLKLPDNLEANTGFGPLQIREAGDHFDLVQDARVGHLVRSGLSVGRVVEVTDQWITLDFGQPFGGETLYCEVKVSGLETGTEEAAGVNSGLEEKPQSSIKSSKVQAQDPVAEANGTKELGDAAQKGDMVAVEYTALVGEEELLATTYAAVGEAIGRRKSEWYRPPVRFLPEQMLLGEDSMPFQGLDRTLENMRLGEKKSIRLDEAFGRYVPGAIIEIPCFKQFPGEFSMDVGTFRESFNRDPVAGVEVQTTPYFTSRVEAVRDQLVVLKALEPSIDIQEDFGRVSFSTERGYLNMRLTPRISAAFDYNGHRGRIIAADEDKFSIDLNHPLAGKPLVVEVEIVGLTKASVLKAIQIPWMQDHDHGLERAASEEKPMLLLLYADWCQWCQRLMAESLSDPRIKMLKDRFVWVRVNSDKQPVLKEAYQQNGFPLMVVMNSKGEVLKKIDGFRDAAALKKELEGVL